jgi:hypothetical protein
MCWDEKQLVHQWGLTDTLSAALSLHCIPLFETTAKHEHSATKVIAVSSAMSPVVTARTVASERGVGGRVRVQGHGAESSSRSASDSKGENRRLDR